MGTTKKSEATKAPAKTEDPVVETLVEEDKAEATKSYTFRSEYPALTVSSLKVQFVKGMATVTDVAVARALATIDGVELVEE